MKKITKKILEFIEAIIIGAMASLMTYLIMLPFFVLFDKKDVLDRMFNISE